MTWLTTGSRNRRNARPPSTLASAPSRSTASFAVPSRMNTRSRRWWAWKVSATPVTAAVTSSPGSASPARGAPAKRRTISARKLVVKSACRLASSRSLSPKRRYTLPTDTPARAATAPTVSASAPPSSSRRAPAWKISSLVTRLRDCRARGRSSAICRTGRSGGGGVALLQRRDHLTGEQARLLAGEGLDEHPARAGLVDDLLEGSGHLFGGAGDRDGGPVRLAGAAGGLEFSVRRGDRTPPAGGVEREELAERLGQLVEVTLRLVLGLADRHEALDHHVRTGAGVPVLGGDLDVVLKRVPVLAVRAEVAHHVPAARGGEPHRVQARPAQPYRQRVLERPGRDRRRALHREELAVEG